MSPPDTEPVPDRTRKLPPFAPDPACASNDPPTPPPADEAPARSIKDPPPLAALWPLPTVTSPTEPVASPEESNTGPLDAPAASPDMTRTPPLDGPMAEPSIIAPLSASAVLPVCICMPPPAEPTDPRPAATFTRPPGPSDEAPPERNTSPALLPPISLTDPPADLSELPPAFRPMSPPEPLLPLPETRSTDPPTPPDPAVDEIDPPSAV